LIASQGLVSAGFSISSKTSSSHLTFGFLVVVIDGLPQLFGVRGLCHPGKRFHERLLGVINVPERLVE
jgi:hypothetical protein